MHLGHTICAAVALTLLQGCGRSYDLARPIEFRPNDTYKVVPPDTQAMVAEGLRLAVTQLGGTIGPTDQQAVTLSYAEQCDDAQGRANTYELRICGALLHSAVPEMVYGLTAHEMGHVLGARHVACDGVSLMCPDWYFEQGVEVLAPRYSAADLAEICLSTTGGVCDSLNDRAMPSHLR